MPQLTRRRDPESPDAWRILADGVDVGSIGRRARQFGASSLIWRCRLAGLTRTGAEHTFDAARAAFETAWQEISTSRSAAGLSAMRAQEAWTAWKNTMHDRGCKLPTEMTSGVSRCLCGAEITICSMDGHVRDAHM